MKRSLKRSIVVLGFCIGAAAPLPAWSQAAPSSQPVSREQFAQLVKVFRSVVQRLRSVELEVRELKGAPAPSGPGDGAVDLSSLDAPVNESKASAGGGSSHGGMSSINFRLLFDMNLYHRPGYATLTFDNFHAFLMAESLPSPTLAFQFDVNPSPRWYELNWTPAKWITLRGGKIWIPFDDMAPHSLFGGRTNVTRLNPDPQFLPNLFTDLGIGVKITPIDKKALKMTVDLYTVNGFGDGGTDLINPGTSYPSLADTGTVADNNPAKSIGGRLHFSLAGGMFGAGVSGYWGPWTDEAAAEKKSLTILGGDLQFRIQKIGLEIRAGMASQLLSLPGGASTLNGASYGEVGLKVLKTRRLKFVARGGTLQLDHRAINPADMILLGGAVLYRFDMVEVSLEGSGDLKKIPGKKNYSFINLRAVLML